MNATQKVATYLGITEINYTKLDVREWAFVYWVKINGKRPTMLSKKLVDRAAKIRIGYTVAGDILAKDEVSGRCFIMRNPGRESGGSYAAKEVKESQLSKSADFSDIRKPVDFRINYTRKPSTVCELMVFKAVANAWSA